MSLRDRLCRPRFLRRPRFQYGMRSLLIATVTFCLALGWYVERVHRQRQAVAALKQAGARVEYSISKYNHYDMTLERAHRTEAIEIDEPRTIAEWFEWLSPAKLRGTLGTDFFRHVDYVDLYEVNDLPSAVRHLPDLHGLRVLHLGTGRTLDDDLSAVGQIGDLTHLDASFSTYITDAGLVYLAPPSRITFLSTIQMRASVLSEAGDGSTDAPSKRASISEMIGPGSYLKRKCCGAKRSS